MDRGNQTASEHQLRIALETARLGSWQLDLRTGAMDCSARCRENFGVADGDPFTYETLRAIIHPNDRDHMQAAVDRAIREGIDYEAQYRITRPNGTPGWIVASGRALYNPDGTPYRMVGITQDITARKEQEEAKTASEERLQFAFAAGGGLGAWDWDVATDRVYANPGFAKLYSVDPDRAAKGAPVSDFLNAIHPDDRDRVSKSLARTVEMGGDFAEEYRLIQQDKSVCWVYALGKCHLSDTGEPLRFPGVVFDVTARRKAEQQTLESQSRLRAIFDGTQEYLGLLTPEGKVLEANRALLEFTHSFRQDLVGEQFWDGPWFSRTEGAPKLVQNAVQRAAAGEFLRYELQARSPSGTLHTFDISFHPIRNQQGQVVYIVPEGRDITDLKAVELRNALLVLLDDSTRLLNEAHSIIETASRLLCEHLSVERCVYGEVESGQEMITVAGSYTVPAAVMRQGMPFTVTDVETDLRMEELRPFYKEAGVRAFCAVPLLKDGRLAATLGAAQSTPRVWRPDELELVQMVASRCWESIERVRVTRELKQSERRLRLGQRAGRIGSFDWVIARNRIVWTPELEALYGIPEGSFEGKFEDWSKRLDADDATRVLSGIERCLKQGEAEYSYEFRAILPSGARRWLLWQAQFFYSAQGEPERMIGVNIDIDAQKQAEEHLRRQWQNFDAVLSNIPDLTYTFDLQGRFTYANRALLPLLQLSLEQVLGKTFFELNYPADLAARLHTQIDQVIDTLSPLRDQTPFTGPTGETRQYEYIFVPVLAGQVIEGVAGSTRDITEWKQDEEQEREREEQIRESARLESLGVMAGGIAHDFNNLLTGILGNACLLAADAQGSDSSIAGQIVIAAERAADLTRQMLAFSGKGRFVVESVDVNALVRDNLMLLRASLSKTVSVELDLTHESCCVEADASQLQQVVMNLLINASEAVGEQPGTVNIRTALTQRTVKLFSPFLQMAVKPGRYVLLEVRDTGCGMTPEILKKIFDPFFTTKFTGRGLGLAAVLGIVKGHLGDLEVVTQPGAGTTFRVLVPLSEKREPSCEDRENIALSRSSGQTILVVDDEEIVRKVAATALVRRGFQVLTANHGEEALASLRNNPKIALVILDLTMPVMTGEQAIPLIKSIRPDVPIVLSSGYNEAEIAHRFASAGISGFLQKPYSVSGIVAKVTEMLNGPPT